MKALVAQIEERLFSAKDTVCLERARLVTEGWRRYAQQPVAIRRAMAFRDVLLHMTLDLKTNPVFAGNTSSGPRAWMLVPEHTLRVDPQVEIEHEELKGFLDDKIPQDIRAFWADHASDGGQGHLAVDLEIVVNRGLRAIIDQIDRLADQGDEAQRVYRQAMRISLEAVIAWAHRYAEAAEQAAEAADDPVIAACHRRVAAACRHVPEHPARNFFEGLQAIALTHLAVAIEGHRLSVSIGLPDRALARFCDEVQADPGGSADLVAAFLLCIAANSFLGRGSKTQAITIGGADHTGADRCNAVTLAFLEGFDRVAVADPHLFLRWHGGLDARVREKALAMLSRGRSMPLLVHDRPTVRGFVEAGVDQRDAWDYCVIGCNELGIPGRMFDSALSLGCTYNDLDLLNRTLLGLADPEAIGSMEELLKWHAAAYEQVIGDGLIERERVQRRIAEKMPTPFTTALMRGGAERGVDLMAAMPYRIPCVYTRGLSNAANALAAIEQLVFVEKRFSLRQLVDALRGNWADERLWQAVQKAPKWGNDDDQADRWALRLIELRRSALQRLANGGLPRAVVCHVVRSLHHLDGRGIAASPDGRRAGAPVCDSIGGVTGTMHEGPTAMLASVLKIDAARDFAGGYNLNITLPAGQADPPVLGALIDGFFGDGGQELQVNVLDPAHLRAAQRQPERFKDLVVRVAGLSARFIELSRAEQDELIERADEAAGR